MNIKVDIKKYERESLKGFVTLTLDDCLVIKDIKIMQSKAGNIFVSFPNKKVGEQYKDIVFPITKEFREELINKIMEKYNEDENHIQEEREAIINEQDYIEQDDDENFLPF